MDRNNNACKVIIKIFASLSARRAWIEIVESGELVKQFDVALRKESVDRNVQGSALCNDFSTSLSARRAWIEMPSADVGSTGQCVALRKESVDRNSCCGTAVIAFLSRSPQGERG